MRIAQCDETYLLRPPRETNCHTHTRMSENIRLANKARLKLNKPPRSNSSAYENHKKEIKVRQWKIP